MKKENNWTYI